MHRTVGPVTALARRQVPLPPPCRARAAPGPPAGDGERWQKERRGSGRVAPSERSASLQKDETMKGNLLLKLYLAVSGAVFLLVALFHLFRLIYHWPIVVGETTIPQFLSHVGFPVSSGYAVWAFWLLRK